MNTHSQWASCQVYASGPAVHMQCHSDRDRHEHTYVRTYIMRIDPSFRARANVLGNDSNENRAVQHCSSGNTEHPKAARLGEVESNAKRGYVNATDPHQEESTELSYMEQNFPSFFPF